MRTLATPTITNATNSGAVGDSITIDGTNFGNSQGTSYISFGLMQAQPSDYLSWGLEQIMCKVPEGASGQLQLTVTTDGGISNSLGFTVNPAITSINPASGTQGYSVSVTNLAGTGFYGTPTVRLMKSGETPITATNVNVVSSTKMTCMFALPANAAAGEWDVYVQNPDGQNATKANAFTVSAPPPQPAAYPTWYLAEGSTAWGYNCYISIENPNNKKVDADITYMTPQGAVSGGTVSLPAMSQTTVNPKDKVGEKDFSTKVEAKGGETIAVDRTMSWTGEGAASPEAHNSVGVNAPAKTWYLAEGSSAWGFECWLLIQNPNNQEAKYTITYMIDGSDPVTVERKVPANSRQSYDISKDIGEKDASIKVESDQPVIPERAMYKNNKREGHDSIGTTTPAQDFYLAEGATGYGPGFVTWVLVQNPNNEANKVTDMVPGLGMCENSKSDF